MQSVNETFKPNIWWKKLNTKEYVLWYYTMKFKVYCSVQGRWLYHSNKQVHDSHKNQNSGDLEEETEKGAWQGFLECWNVLFLFIFGENNL